MPQQPQGRDPRASAASAHAGASSRDASDASADDKSDTDDEHASMLTLDADSHGANDVDPDAQIEALDDDIIFGVTATSLLSENERAVKLTMQLIRESVYSASVLEPKRDDEEDEDDDKRKQYDEQETMEQKKARLMKQFTPELEEEQEIEALLQKKILRLDWLNIGRIENLDAFTHIQELYLQHNLIEVIENLDDHHELTFLALGGNRIEKVEGLRHLTNLKFLDLSNNCIEDFDICEFPESLMILRLAGNPFIRHMPSLRTIFNIVGPAFVFFNCVLSTNSTMLTASAKKRELLAQRSEEDIILQEFDLTAYEEQRAQRMENWEKQLKDLETRKAELEFDPLVLGTSKHSRTLERARAGTKTAIAESVSHFQQMERQHKEWQEAQQQQMSPAS
uniref:U2A'/phosphoprotein 32 family A C-terminal domain-containing protein n=1 Tax=Globisporangium ultimum (strain ATCC 200006 / CBS 805.95 / DAOM BR144) TaxID=431595 RepID=K3WS91_GLOUD